MAERRKLTLVLLFVAGCAVRFNAVAGPPPLQGQLRVHQINPRYFTNDSGRAIFLTGSHTWGNFKDIDATQDSPISNPPRRLDWDAHLDALDGWGHNFIRLWTWELFQYQYSPVWMLHTDIFPWERVGPGLANDGNPKFDLMQWNEAYFLRLRSRAQIAGERGFYVSIMLFEGHGLQKSRTPWAWDGHPFNAHNNVNGIGGDLNGDGRGLEIHTLEIPAVTALQWEYVRRVIDSVNDLDNVLYEVANEAGPYSTQWQYYLIDAIHGHEATLPKQHPVGMTFQYEGGDNGVLFESKADWISPSPDGGYRDDPPASDGRKVIVSDTDHLWGIGGNAAWVWKSFLRGINPIYMDSFGTQGLPSDESIRRNMGYARRLADRINLASMTPRGELASTGYCLANDSASEGEYLVYSSEGGEITVDLLATRDTLDVQWFQPDADMTHDAESVSGGTRQTFVAPFAGPAVLYLRAR